MHALDNTLVIAMNGYANSNAFLKIAVIFFAQYSAYALAAIAAYIAFHSRASLKKNVVAVTLATGAGLIARFAVKGIITYFYPYPRPFVALQSVHALIASVGENYQSFPSGHAIFFFAFASVINHFDKKWGMVFFVTAILMGIARVAAGVHYPSDIVAGAVLGIATAAGALYAYRKQHGNY